MVTKVNSSNFAPAVNETITAAASIPTISNVQATNSSYVPLSGNYLDTVATAYIKITGTNFFAGSQVFVEGQLASSITYVSATQLNVILPNKSAGTYVLYVVNPDGSVAIRINAVTYSASPVWSTSSTLSSANDGSSVSIQLAATSDSSIVYAVTSGTLPPGLSLSTSGLLSGTVTGVSAETTYNFTVTATDTESQVNPSSFSINITVSDPYFKYTSLLLNGETTVTPFIKDASTNNLGLTIQGDTKATNFSPYQGDGYYSNYFNGSSAIKTPASSLTTILGTSTVTTATVATLEFWVYETVRSTETNARSMVGEMNPTAGSNDWGIGISSSGYVNYSWYTGSVNNAQSSTTIVPLNTWTHVAVVWNAGNIKIFVNGILQTLTSNTITNVSSTHGYLSLGGWNNFSSTEKFTGYVSNLRVTKSALYTESFTAPTTPFTAIANTSLLINQSNRFIDNSTNAYALTLVSTPQVSPAIPFASSSSYATFGSAYFDGTGDYLTETISTATVYGTGDFTVEYWVYITVNNGSFQTHVGRATDANSFAFGTNGTPVLYWTTVNTSSTGATTLKLNQWYHVAWVRTSGTLKAYLNGVQDYTGSVSIDITTSGFGIGGQPSGTLYPFGGGYLSDIRIIKGTALYTTNFTPPTTPLTAVTNTQLLTCQYNGGANNSGIIDNGPFNNVITRLGNTSQGTFSPYSQTGHSTYFDGTVYPGFSVNNTTTPLNFAAGQDFTMEFWVYSTSSLSDYHLVNYGTYKEAYTSERVILITNKSASVYILGTAYTINYTTLTTNTWNHVALVRYNNNITVYLNGVSGPTTSAPGAAQPSSTRYDLAGPHGLWFGVNTTNWTGFSPTLYTGYMSNFRYVVGTALYTSNFTPTTSQLTAITNTQVLTHQNNRLKDNSANALAYTLNGSGSASIQAWSPFSPTGTYSPSVNSGSAYFDGTGDYLSIPPSTAFTFTGDFTIEAWVYPTVINADNCIISRWTSSLSFIFKIVSSGRPYFAWYKGGSGTVTGTTTAVRINQWNHVAVTRVGSTVRLFVNGELDSTTGTIAGALDNSTTAITVGSLDTTPSQVWNGYLSDVRVINGTALYSASFTPPTSTLTNTTSTNLLLNFTNSGIIDQHSGINLETVGNAQLSTAVKKFGNTSIYFDGAGDRLATSPGPQNSLGSGDFTIEFWVYSITLPANARLLSQGSPTTGEHLFIVYSSGAADFCEATTARLSFPSGSFVTATWQHIAIVRSSTTLKGYVNGSSVVSTTSTYNYSAVTNTYIGSNPNTGSQDFNGYIDDLRITKGYARYTSNFTVPAALLTR